MRFRAVLTAFGIVMLTVTHTSAQTYGSSFPVCLQVYGQNSYIDCRFGSISQCQAVASGRAAQCIVNPYYGGDARPRHRRRHY